MADTAVPILTSIVPLGAVPERLRAAAAKVLAQWSYSWGDVTFAGTAEAGHAKEAGHGKEIWIFAITAGPLAVGDELQSAGGRSAGVGVSAFSGGVIPVTPYQAVIHEYLGRRGGGPAPERGSPPETPDAPALPTVPEQPPTRAASEPTTTRIPTTQAPTTPEMVRAVPDPPH